MNRDVLCRQLGYRFEQPAWLERALTHRSYSADHNERLEFLGDSVLNCTVAAHLFASYPDLSEGDLSRLRANLVNQQTLFGLAQQLRLGEQLKLGEGERKTAGFRRPSTLADALEAVFGAIFLDGGFVAAQQAVLKLYLPLLAEANVKTLGKDPKTLLQEWLQAKKLALPQYAVMAVEGEAHEQLFRVTCQIPALQLTTSGSGASRRQAEQAAAETAYQKLTAA